MAFIEGATFSGKFSELTVVINRTKPTSGQGATLGSHSVERKSEANVNSGATIGAAVGVYAPQLAILFGTDDF